MSIPEYVVVGFWGTYSESRTADDLRHAGKISAGWKGRRATRIEIHEIDGIVEVKELAWERAVVKE
jgi:hypothetical protein